MFALLFFIAHVTLSGTDSKFLPIYILPPPPPPEKEYKIYLDRVACFVKRIQDKNLAIFTNIELQVQFTSTMYIQKTKIQQAVHVSLIQKKSH